MASSSWRSSMCSLICRSSSMADAGIGLADHGEQQRMATRLDVSAQLRGLQALRFIGPAQRSEAPAINAIN